MTTALVVLLLLSGGTLLWQGVDERAGRHALLDALLVLAGASNLVLGALLYGADR